MFTPSLSGLIRKEHPGVALSIKTDQATRSVLNNCQDNIKQLLSGGLLDEIEADRLLQVSATCQIQSQTC